MCKTIKQKVRFAAPPTQIYRLLTDETTHAAFTGAQARIDRRPGGRFSSYGGAISGINVDLAPGKRLVQAWQDRSFPEGIFSMATFVLSPTPSGGTELVLTHRGVPKERIPRIEEQWRERYWARMKEFLGSARKSGR